MGFNTKMDIFSGLGGTPPCWTAPFFAEYQAHQAGEDGDSMGNEDEQLEVILGYVSARSRGLGYTVEMSHPVWENIPSMKGDWAGRDLAEVRDALDVQHQYLAMLMLPCIS